jgi:hypothetical protein
MTHIPYHSHSKITTSLNFSFSKVNKMNNFFMTNIENLIKDYVIRLFEFTLYFDVSDNNLII